MVKTKDKEEMSRKACEMVVEKMTTMKCPTLGLATGSTPEGLYQLLIEAYKQGDISFADTTTFNLDEYAGLTADDPNSYQFFMNEKLFNHIDIPDKQTHIPRGGADDLEKECSGYEKLIKAANHMDVQVLGLGLNGHIGFNEPGTNFDSRTHIVELDDSTRQANARFFGSKDEVPTKAITMGIETIMESKQIILLVAGENKADAVNKLVNGEISEEFPASILRKHENVVVIGDEKALSKL